MKDLLGLAAGAVTLITVTALTLSVVYEWGYFSIVGPDFLRMASTTDYLTNAVTWLPGSLAAFAFSQVLWLTIRRSERWIPHQVLTHSESFRRHDLIIHWLHLITFPILAIVSFTFMPAGIREILIAPAVSVIWFVVFNWIFSHEWAPNFPSPAIRTVAFIGPAILVWIYAFGTFGGFADLLKEEADYEILRAGELTPTRVNVLRSFDRGLLIRSPALATNDFVQWSEAKSLRRVAKPALTSLVCGLSGWACIRHPTVSQP